MLGNNSQMEYGKKDPRCTLSQDSGNVLQCLLFVVNVKKQFDLFVCFKCKKHDDSWEGTSGMMIYCDCCLEWFHWYVKDYISTLKHGWSLINKLSLKLST